MLRLARTDIPPVGDEFEYIERGTRQHPFTDKPFFRVPVLPGAAWLAGRIGDPARGLRVMSAVCSSLAIGAAAGAAARVGGTPIAVVLTLLLLATPERFLLGARIWPDVWLAAATSIIVLILTLTPTVIEPRTAAVLIGSLSAFAALTRVDGVVLVPTVAVVWSAAGLPMPAGWLIWSAGLPAGLFAGWWLIAAVLFGQRWPDTTWRFNLEIAAVEATHRQRTRRYTVDDLIVAGRKAETGNLRSKPAPWHAHIAAVLARARAMLGPDTFIRGKLLEETGDRHHDVLKRVLEAMLRFATPLWIAGAAVLTGVAPSPAALLAVPALALAIPAVVFHARTRYRLPLIYGLVPAVAGSTVRLLTGPTTGIDWLVVAAAGTIVGLLLSRDPDRTERPWQTG